MAGDGDGRGRRPVVSDRELLAVFANDDSDWPLSTEDVAAEVEIADVYRRLQQLAEDGYLDSRKYGSARAYRLTDAGRTFLNADDGE